jgi:hypothetical protein
MCRALASLLILAGASTARAGTLWVVLPGEGQPCEFEQFATALRARLPETQVMLGLHDVSAEDVVVTLARDGDDWSLEVRAAGQPQLRRALQRPGGECVALSETVALMVDRYLDDIHWTGGRVVVGKLAPPPPPPPPAHWQLVAELAIGGSTGLQETIASPSASGQYSTQPGYTPAYEANLGVRHGIWQIEVGGTLFLPPSQVTLTANDPTTLCSANNCLLQVLNIAVQLPAGLHLNTGFGAFRAEVVPGLDVLWASSSGPGVIHPASTTPANATPAFCLGLRIGYEFPLISQLFVAIRVESHVVLEETTFAANPTSNPSDFQEKISTGRFEGSASIGLGYAFF